MGAGGSGGRAVPACLSGLHPAVPLAFAACAVLCAFALSAPAFTAVSFACATACSCALDGSRALRRVAGLLPLALLVAAVNPLFNTSGATVLFTYAAGRPYTFEALAYGLSTGFSLVSALLWFACLDRMVPADRLRALVGTRAPAVALVLSMVARLVPRYARRAGQVADAQAGIGLGGRTVFSAARTLASLTAWALDDGVVAADSMRARGYGAARRTTCNPLRWRRADTLFCLAGALLAGVFLVGAAHGAASASFVPTIALPRPDAPGVAALAAYGAFLLAPTAMAVGEEVRWRASLSKI
jgi:energy-coupling factor transport system permease protein